MSSSTRRREYVLCTDTNGSRSADWITNKFAKFRTEPIKLKKGEDPCNIPMLEDENKDNKKQGESIIKKYKHQEFIAEYLAPSEKARELLLYWGLGTGKTIGVIRFFLKLFEETDQWNIYILTKASLRETPWERDLKKFIPKDQYNKIMKKIDFVNYNGNGALGRFQKLLQRNYDPNPEIRSVFIIEESHSFIGTVRSNLLNPEGVSESLGIYRLLTSFRERNPDSWMILLSGTPAVNTSFELGLTFNLMKKNLFPENEDDFLSLYEKNGVLSMEKKELFQRYIQDRVSYYRGSLPGRFAKKNIKVIKCPLFGDTLKIYEQIEQKEEDSDRRKQGKWDSRSGIEISGVRDNSRDKAAGSDSYRTGTRLAGNFVAPYVNNIVNGQTKPKRSDYGASSFQRKDASNKQNTSSNKLYENARNNYFKTIGEYWAKLKKADGLNWENDIKAFRNEYKGDVELFLKKRSFKSKCLKSMYESSPKYFRICLYLEISKGPAMVFSRFVQGEGVQAFTIFLESWGFSNFLKKRGSKSSGRKTLKYAQANSLVQPKYINKALEYYNKDSNISGKLIKVIILTPKFTEGISLKNVRQVHIIEPHWHEGSVDQAIGRAIRDCSHKLLPIEDRIVDIYRYLSTRVTLKKDKVTARLTTDERIFEKSQQKKITLQTFLQAVRESAIDSRLFLNHNNIPGEGSVNVPFNYPRNLRTNNPESAYTTSLDIDLRKSQGMNYNQDKLELIRVTAVLGRRPPLKGPFSLGYDTETGELWNIELSYPIGIVKKDSFGMPEMYEDHFWAKKVWHTPVIEN